MPVLNDIDHTLKHLRGWMRVQRRQADRLAFGLVSNRGVPQPLCVLGVDFALRTVAERILYSKCLNAGQIRTTVDQAYVSRAKRGIAQRLAPDHHRRQRAGPPSASWLT